jgi:hypothetical protein
MQVRVDPPVGPETQHDDEDTGMQVGQGGQRARASRFGEPPA